MEMGTEPITNEGLASSGQSHRERRPEVREEVDWEDSRVCRAEMKGKGDGCLKAVGPVGSNA